MQKKQFLIAFLVMVVSALLPRIGQAAESDASSVTNDVAPELRLSVRLRDDSRIIGTPMTNSLPLATDFGDFEIAWRSIQTVNVVEQPHDVIVKLVNGDRITARVQCEDIALQTIFADVILSFSYIEEITVHTGTLTAGLMLHYDFNDDEDDLVVDRSGHEHHGTAMGNLRYVEQPDGLAIQTSSRQTYVMGNSPQFSLNGHRQLTAAVRVKLQSYTTYGRLLTKTTQGEGSSRALVISVGGRYSGRPYDGWFDIQLAPGEIVRLRLKQFAELGRWYHLAGVFDGRSMTFYVDGIEYAKRPVPDALRNQPILDHPNNDLFIGMCANVRTWHDAHINGLIDDVRIYGRALSAAEIRALAKDG